MTLETPQEEVDKAVAEINRLIGALVLLPEPVILDPNTSSDPEPADPSPVIPMPAPTDLDTNNTGDANFGAEVVKNGDASSSWIYLLMICIISLLVAGLVIVQKKQDVIK